MMRVVSAVAVNDVLYYWCYLLLAHIWAHLKAISLVTFRTELAMCIVNTSNWNIYISHPMQLVFSSTEWNAGKSSLIQLGHHMCSSELYDVILMMAWRTNKNKVKAMIEPLGTISNLSKFRTFALNKSKRDEAFCKREGEITKCDSMNFLSYSCMCSRINSHITYTNNSCLSVKLTSNMYYYFVNRNVRQFLLLEIRAAL